MRVFSRVAPALCLLFVSLPSLAAPIDLYDGGQSSLPSAQGWLYLTNPLFGASASQQPVAGGVRLVSPVAEQAGWFSTLHPGVPLLPAGGAFDIDFTLRLVDESHANPNRAGFGVIVLDDAATGIELGFWTDRIWAQNDSPLFTHGEEAFFDTARLVDYRLSFAAAGYTLYADGSPILSGARRDYSAHGNPVYANTNFLFFGDDTSSAGAEVEIHSIAVDSLAATMPSPAVIWLMLPLVFGLTGSRRAPRARYSLRQPNLGTLARALSPLAALLVVVGNGPTASSRLAKDEMARTPESDV